MILIVTDAFDKHADRVIECLAQSNIKPLRFNLDVGSLKQTKIHFSHGEWNVQTLETSFSSLEVTCVWMRRAFVELTLEEQSVSSSDNDFKLWRNEWNRTLQGFFMSLKSLPWLNPLKEAFSAENKYLQIAVAKDLGLEMPNFIVSNDKNELLNFANLYDSVVMKLMSQEFYLMDDGTFQGIYVNKVSAEELDEFCVLGENPIMLQKYINKQYEVRYTVVGKEHFVCKIDSQKSLKASVDWRRYDIPNTPHASITPPSEIKDKVELLMSNLGLEYGALDFIVTDQNEWIFLEVNSMGQWLWIEDLVNLPISNSIAMWLIANHAVKEVKTDESFCN